MQYLKLRHNTYSARVQIPPHLWPVAGGKREYVRSLKTSDKREANRLKAPVVAEFQRRIAALAKGGTDPDAALFTRALELRATIEQLRGHVVTNPAGDPVSAADDATDILLAETREILETRGPLSAERFHRAATTNVILVSEHSATWLAQQTGITQQHMKRHERAFAAFLAWSGASVSIAEVGRKKAGEYVNQLLDPAQARKRSTTVHYISTLANYWDWLISRGHADDEKGNPWRGQKLGKKAKHDATTARRQWRDDELVILLSATPKPRDAILLDLTRIALATGCRIEELCALEVVDVESRDDGLWLNITKGKTDASIRSIPVHPIVAPVFERLIAGRTSGFLFATLEASGPDSKRSVVTGKRFSAFKVKLGFDHPGLVFHSLRKTFMDMLEGEGVPESTVKLIVGHARPSMTFGVYSAGERVNLRAAIARLSYSPQVMALLPG